jgi:hypothetical protein
VVPAVAPVIAAIYLYRVDQVQAGKVITVAPIMVIPVHRTLPVAVAVVVAQEVAQALMLAAQGVPVLHGLMVLPEAVAAVAVHTIRVMWDREVPAAAAVIPAAQTKTDKPDQLTPAVVVVGVPVAEQAVQEVPVL